MRHLHPLAALLLVAACTSATAGTPSANLVSVATFKPLPSGECPAGTLDGVRLRGDPAASSPVWVESPQGAKLRILWPNGYSARFNPKLELLDADGKVVAREGDVLNLSGGQIDPAFDWFACQTFVKTATP